MTLASFMGCRVRDPVVAIVQVLLFFLLTVSFNVLGWTSKSTEEHATIAERIIILPKI